MTEISIFDQHFGQFLVRVFSKLRFFIEKFRFRRKIRILTKIFIVTKISLI